MLAMVKAAGVSPDRLHDVTSIDQVTNQRLQKPAGHLIHMTRQIRLVFMPSRGYGVGAGGEVLVARMDDRSLADRQVRVAR